MIGMDWLLEAICDIHNHKADVGDKQGITNESNLVIWSLYAWDVSKFQQACQRGVGGTIKKKYVSSME